MVSFSTVCSEGIQLGVPPLNGTAALASTVKSTSPAAGVEYVNPDAEKRPTLGLLAGTTSVYNAQFAAGDTPPRQCVETETRPVEFIFGVVLVAGMVCNGIVTCCVVFGPDGAVCSAERLTSMVPATAPLVAVTIP